MTTRETIRSLARLIGEGLVMLGAFAVACAWLWLLAGEVTP